jgi:hypothetical protein
LKCRGMEKSTSLSRKWQIETCCAVWNKSKGWPIQQMKVGENCIDKEYSKQNCLCTLEILSVLANKVDYRKWPNVCKPRPTSGDFLSLDIVQHDVYSMLGLSTPKTRLEQIDLRVW